MREILFRGKRLDNDEWVEGSLSLEYYKNHGCVMISPNEDKCYKVDPDTVCEYTGLTDKNGKKVFEGDIVTVHIDYDDGLLFGINKNDIGVIRWDNESSRYYIESDKETYYATEWFVEVIGNKFDNPELLEMKR